MLIMPNTPGLARPRLYAPNEIGPGVIREGLIAEYRFNDQQWQQLTDYSGNGYHGILGANSGVGTDDPTWVQKGLYFGGDDYVTCPQILALNGNPSQFTVQVICKPTVKSNQIVWGYGTGAGAQSFGLSLRSTGDIRYFVYSADTDGGSYNINEIMCLSIVKNGADGSLYKNNSFYFARTFSTLNIIYGAHKIGALLGEMFSGDIYYATIYNRALTAAEIVKNYVYLRTYLLQQRGIILP